MWEKNILHMAQLLRHQEKIKWTGGRHIVALLKMWIYFHVLLKPPSASSWNTMSCLPRQKPSQCQSHGKSKDHCACLPSPFFKHHSSTRIQKTCEDKYSAPQLLFGWGLISAVFPLKTCKTSVGIFFKKLLLLNIKFIQKNTYVPIT